jgi:hypothetical protein
VGPAKALTNGKRERVPGAAAGSRAADRDEPLLDLQRQAGNRAVTRLVRSVVQRDKAGWSDADTRGEAFNAGEHAIGAMRRIPIEGITGGHREQAPDPDKTNESAAGRAIAVVPAALVTAKPVDVLLHLHGYTGRPGDPYPGWRQRRSDNTVRDVALDRIEQQLEATGATQLLGVLPQGGGASEFGNLDPDRYIGEVFDRLTAVGALDARPKLGRVLLSAHSGGGHRVRRLLDNDALPAGKRKGRAGLPGSLGQLMLYDALTNDDELKSVQRWVTAQLDSALAVLADPAVPAADKDAYLARSPRFVGYYASYAKRYRLLAGTIDAWFDRHAAELGGHTETLRSHFQVLRAKGLGHEEVIRGRRKDDSSRPGEGNLANAVRSFYGLSPAPASAPAAVKAAAAKAPAGPDPIRLAGQLTRILGVAPAALVGWTLRVAAGADPVTAAVSSAAAAGYRDDVELTDLVFAVRHPELGGGRIPAGDKALTEEWRTIRRLVVRLAIRAGIAATPAAAGKPAPAITAPSPAAAAPSPAAAAPAAAKPSLPAAARALTDEQRAKLIAETVDQATAGAARAKLTAGGKLSKKERAAIAAADAMADDLKDSGTTAETWFAGMVPDASFLGIPIRRSGGAVDGVHRELLAVLQAAEAALLKRHPGMTPRQVAATVGVYDIAGLRPPKNATGGTRPSMHCYGMAVDINYRGNPFVGQGKRGAANPQTEMIKRATLLMNGSPFDIGRSPKGLGKTGLGDSEAARSARAGRAGEMWERFHTASEAVRAYLSLSDTELAARVAADGHGNDLTWWTAQLAADRALIGRGEFANHADPSKSGFMDLGRELVEVLVSAGLSWGGCYATGKDLMHFDLRTGTIKGRDVL